VGWSSDTPQFRGL